MKNEYITLEQFLKQCDSSTDKGLDELQKFFLGMDKKMHIYHQNDYIITSYRIQDIVLSLKQENNNEYYDVVFLKYEQVSSDIDTLIQKNIFYAGCLAVGIYNNCLSYIDPDHPGFLKKNFNLFAENMPVNVVPYYRGIIERNSTVYLNDFEDMRRKREIEAMKMQAELESKRSESRPVSAKASRKNDKWGTTESAFIGFSLFPCIIVLLGILIPMVIALLA